jgi:hypothetical protein
VRAVTIGVDEQCVYTSSVRTGTSHRNCTTGYKRASPGIGWITESLNDLCMWRIGSPERSPDGPIHSVKGPLLAPAPACAATFSRPRALPDANPKRPSDFGYICQQRARQPDSHLEIPWTARTVVFVFIFICFFFFWSFFLSLLTCLSVYLHTHIYVHRLR